MIKNNNLSSLDSTFFLKLIPQVFQFSNKFILLLLNLWYVAIIPSLSKCLELSYPLSGQSLILQVFLQLGDLGLQFTDLLLKSGYF